MIDLIGPLIARYGYVIIALVIAAEGVGIPLPGETALLTAAAFAARGKLSIVGVILASTIGTVLGGSGGYWIGRTGGIVLVRRVGKWVGLDEHSLQKAHDFFTRHGAKTVFAARFIALLRIASGLLAGAAEMPFSTFSIYNALGGFTWSLVIGVLGYEFGEHLHKLDNVVGRWALIGLGVVLVGYLVWRWARRRAAGAGAPMTPARAAWLAGRIALVGAVVYVVVLVGAVVTQQWFVFPGTLIPGRVSSDTAIGARRIDFQSTDGIAQVAWQLDFPGGGSPYWMLYFHGNGTTVPLQRQRYALFRALGFNVFAPEYRGYAGVPGRPSEAALEHDAAAAFDYLVTVEHVPADHVVIYGWSLGSAVAIDLATKRSARALLVEGSPASVVAVGARDFFFLPVDWLMTSNRFESDRKIEAVHAPILVVHGAHDRRVPIANGRRIYALANPPKAFLELPEGGHDNAPAMSDSVFLAGVRDFLQQQAGISALPR
jgi:membrane protein DedA with SNARE-associated domain/pimeloyl-ACP methyl ester carboxylesterase